MIEYLPRGFYTLLTFSKTDFTNYRNNLQNYYSALIDDKQILCYIECVQGTKKKFIKRNEEDV